MAVTIVINGKREEAEGPITISEVLASRKIRPEVVSVALNKAFLKRDAFDGTTAVDGDRVEIMIQLAGGSHD